MEKLFVLSLNSKKNEYRIEGYKGLEEKEIIIPQKYNEIPITSINKKLFSKCTELERVEIKAKIEELPRETFAYCENLREVILPKSIKQVNEYVFTGCTNLKKIIFPARVKFAVSAIRYSGIEEFNIPKTMKQIPGGFFEGTNIKKIIIPYWVKEIGSTCFRYSRIEKVIIQNGVKKIYAAFWDCINLKQICLPPSIEYITTDEFVIWENYRPTTINGKPDRRYAIRSQAVPNSNVIVYAEPGSYVWQELRGYYTLKDIANFDSEGCDLFEKE